MSCRKHQFRRLDGYCVQLRPSPILLSEMFLQFQHAEEEKLTEEREDEDKVSKAIYLRVQLILGVWYLHDIFW